MNKSKKNLMVIITSAVLLIALFGILTGRQAKPAPASAASLQQYHYFKNKNYNSGLFLCPGCNNFYTLSYSSIGGDVKITFALSKKGENGKDNAEHTTSGFAYSSSACYLNLRCTYSGGSYDFILGFHQTSLQNWEKGYSWSVYMTEAEGTAEYCSDRYWTCKCCNTTGYQVACQKNASISSRTPHEYEWKNAGTKIHKEVCALCRHESGQTEECSSFTTSTEEATSEYCQDTKYICKLCEGYYYESSNGKNRSSHNKLTIPSKDPTCTEVGHKEGSQCSKCGYLFSDCEEIPALGHSYKSSKSNSTCTEKGNTLYQCERCGYAYRGDEKAPLGHRYSDIITAATCTSDGYTKHTCSRCGDSYIDAKTKALGHRYSIIQNVTCTSGAIVYACTVCGTKKTENSGNGMGHNYISSVIPPTCEEDGYTLYQCSRCEESYCTDEKPALGHTFTGGESKPATCTEFGKTVYTCQVCGSVKEENDGTYPMGHSFSNSVVRVPTCTDEGLRRSVCDLCGKIEEHKIAARGHSYEITESADRGDNIIRTYTCSFCHASYTQELGDQYAHVTNYVEYLFDAYSPYMFWVLLATAGLWSIAIGIAIIIAVRNDEKVKARKMLVNYLIGLVVIAAIVVACPYLVRGIASLVG